jgi:hypothetical protein
MSEEIKPTEPENVSDEQLEDVAGGWFDVNHSTVLCIASGSSVV